ncbi:MAG: hypothetical protein GVY36_17040 [Verrucomicrobia bacterium]|nr:hypothetical protein [Verrucomicrobiota bacterium]
MFPYEVGSHLFLPLSMSFNVETNYNEETSHRDILFFEIWREKIESKYFDLRTTFDISSDRIIPKRLKKLYFISGFPNELQEVEYENRRLRQQSCQIELSEVYETDVPGISECRFSANAGLSSFSGFSGGGIFSLTPQGGKYHAQFEGILLQATSVDWNIGRFIRAELIRDYILKQQSGSDEELRNNYPKRELG